MIKKIAVVTVLLLAMSNIALAKFSDEWKAQNPGKYTIKTEQDISGKVSTIEEYRLFKDMGLELTVGVVDGVKACNLYLFYSGRQWMFYDKLYWGDGTTAHEFTMIGEPTHRANGGYVHELICFRANPTELKKAITISSHGKQEGNRVRLTANPPSSENVVKGSVEAFRIQDAKIRWRNWTKALDDAEKLMAE